MAMEIKTLEIKNSEEQSTIEFWSQFGWNLKSSQRVFNKDSHLERRGDSTYSVTETVDFTKLVFERDKSHPNYQQIVQLEGQYLRYAQSMPKDRPQNVQMKTYDEWKKTKIKGDLRLSKGEKVLSLLLIIIGAALVVVFESIEMNNYNMIVQAFGVLILIFGIVYNIITRKKALNAAIASTEGAAYEKLRSIYNNYVQKCEKTNATYANYENSVRRMSAILEELKTLVD